MRIDPDKIEFLYPSAPALDGMTALRAFRPFADEICRFLNALSQTLMADKEAKTYPDVVTFGFFCRKGNVEKLRETYGAQIPNRLGRGVTFHIAPSNVPINFAYSLVCGLLAGNACIVRAPTKPFPQTDIVCRAVRRVFENDAFPSLKNHVVLARYDRDNEITACFSSLCDVRIIWGGDDTVHEIRNIPIPPRAFDLSFADRYSMCVIQAAAYLKNSDPLRTARDFYNDTYLFDQNACSSPRLMVWIGPPDVICEAKRRFWDALHEYVKERYAVEPVIAVDKFTALCRCAIDLAGVTHEKTPDHLIDRIRVETLSANLERYRCAGGSFLEYDDQNLNAYAIPHA